MDVNTILNSVILILGFWLVRYIRQQDAEKKANEIYQKETRKETEAYQKATTTEMNEIKLNYLDRFDEVKALIVESENRLFDRLYSIFKHK